MPRYALRFEFDGRDWSGTATQVTGGNTLQDAVERVLADHAGAAVKLITCGRLDAGVSALDFVAHCDLPDDRPAVHIARMLNARLPAELAVVAAARVDDTWHARLSANGKTYRYTLLERHVRPAFDRHLLWVRPLPHPERLQPWAERLLGHQDLAGFACLRGDITDSADPRHTVSAVRWTEEPRWGGTLRQFTISGDGFLYKQVRGFVGALLAVARDRDGRAGKRFERNLRAGRDPAQRSGDIAPAHGLCLERVHYDPQPPWQMP